MSASLFFLFPPFRLELENEQLWRESELIPLRRKTFAVLRYLVEHHGQLVTKDQLFAAVWAETYVEDVAVAICIRELRKALGDEARTPRFIETIRGRGYRFLAPLTIAQPPSQQSQANSQLSFPALRPQLPARPFVGRAAELAQLHGWWEKALSGNRQMVFVTGEPGIGKTSLIDTFLADVGAALRGHPTSGQLQGATPTQDLWLTQGQCG